MSSKPKLSDLRVGGLAEDLIALGIKGAHKYSAQALEQRRLGLPNSDDAMTVKIV